MPALDISLGHRMIRRATDVLDVLAVERRGQDVSEEHISKEGRARRDHGVSRATQTPYDAQSSATELSADAVVSRKADLRPISRN
jgi:hypothetical protein